MGEAENRTAYNKNTRHYEMTDVSRGYNLGPVAYSDLQSRERLDRPMVKVYNRHPGTNVPDARDLIRVSRPKLEKHFFLGGGGAVFLTESRG